MTALAIVFAAASFHTAEVCNLVSNPLPHETSVSYEDTFGSSDRMSAETKRTTANTINALVELSDAYYERVFFSCAGRSNEWSEVAYGPTPYDEFHNFDPARVLLNRSNYGDFKYSSFDTNGNGRLVAPNSYRLIDLDNAHSLARDGIKDLVDGIGGHGLILRRGKSWEDEPEGEEEYRRRLFWSSSRIAEISNRGLDYQYFTLTSGNIDFSKVGVPLAAYETGGYYHNAYDLHSVRYGASVMSEVLDYFWIAGVRPNTSARAQELGLFDFMLTSYFATSAEELLYPGDARYTGYLDAGQYTRRLVPDEYYKYDDLAFAMREVSPLAAAGRCLYMLDRTLEPYHRKSSYTNEFDYLNVNFSSGGSEIKFMAGISRDDDVVFNRVIEFGDDKVYVKFIQDTSYSFNFNTDSYALEEPDQITVTTNRTGTNCNRMRFRSSGISFSPGDVSLDAEVGKVMTFDVEIDASDVPNAINTLGPGAPTDPQGRDWVNMNELYYHPLLHHYEFFVHDDRYIDVWVKSIQPFTEGTNRVHFGAGELTLIATLVNPRFQIEIGCTDISYDPFTFDEIMSYAGPSELAYNADRVKSCRLISAFNLMTINEEKLPKLDLMVGPWSWNDKVEQIHAPAPWSDESFFVKRMYVCGTSGSGDIYGAQAYSEMNGRYESALANMRSRAIADARLHGWSIEEAGVNAVTFDGTKCKPGSVNKLALKGDVGFTLRWPEGAAGDVRYYVTVGSSGLVNDDLHAYYLDDHGVRVDRVVDKLVFTAAIFANDVDDYDGTLPNVPDKNNPEDYDYSLDLIKLIPPAAADCDGAGLIDTVWKWRTMTRPDQ